MIQVCSNWALLILLLVGINSKDTLGDGKPMNEFIVQIHGGYSEALSVAKQSGFILDHKMIGFEDLFVFKYNRRVNVVNKFHQHRVKRNSKVTFIEQQVAKKRVKRALAKPGTSLTFNDPLYANQWYLMRSQRDTNQFDMNVIEAWNLGFTGKGVVVTILDDGIDYRHPDLKDNYDSQASYDVNDNDRDPLPNYKIMDNRHGTRCAGEVAAKANNYKCGVGVAFNSRIGGVRMLDGTVNDRVEAEALGLNQQYIDIYSGSWGPDDDGQTVDGPARFAKAAFDRGVKHGRKGLGNIYIWASGNGGLKYDSCACDGYASSVQTISVSSVSERNLKPWYLEGCASTLISTYSSGDSNEQKIISADLNGNCALDHTGTSASAPIAAGIVALLLEANGNLTWRDVQYISVVTANTLPFTDTSFITNGANRKVSNLYGFGLMDAGKMVRLGRLWQTLPPQHMCRNTSSNINRALVGDFKVTVSIDISGCSGNNVVNYVEHVVLALNVAYQRRGDLQLYLISPSGTRSEILPFRNYDSHSGNATFDKWPLMSVQFWGELCSGKWLLEMRNKKSNSADNRGILRSFSLEVYGTDKFPMRLRVPSKKDNDHWFQQFERYVVYGDYRDFPEHKRYHHTQVTATSNGTNGVENIKCHNHCANDTCKGPVSPNCVSCKKFHNYDGSCVDQCQAGTYLNISSSSCVPCHFSCDECIGEGKYNCSKCYVSDWFVGIDKQCRMSLSRCPLEFYNHSSICTKCQDNCSICTSNTKCSHCKDGFVLTLNSQCKLACDLGSYVDSRGRCRVCHGDCLSCINGGPYECNSCSYASYKLKVHDDANYGRCVADCRPSSFTNHTTDVCYRCHQNCKTCTGPSSVECTDCIPPLEMSEADKICIDPVTYNCKPDEFKTANGTCEKCPISCKTCANGLCTSCPLNMKFVFNGSCVEKCPKEYFYIAENKVCLMCKSFCDLCNQNESLAECKQCFPNINNCTSNCKEREYWSLESRSCRTCYSSCSSCSGGDSGSCLKCSNSDYFLSRGQCIEGCPFGESRYESGAHKICIPCHSSCKNASCDKENGKCTQCPRGHKLSRDGICERIITCPMSDYWSPNGTCEACNDSCRSCYRDGLCGSCLRDHCLHPSSSTCQPCCSPFWPIKNCFKCVAGHEFCDIIEIPSPVSKGLIFLYFVAVISPFVILFPVVSLVLYRREVCHALPKCCSTRSPIEYTLIESSCDLYDNHSEQSDSPFIPLSTLSVNGCSGQNLSPKCN